MKKVISLIVFSLFISCSSKNPLEGIQGSYTFIDVFSKKEKFYYTAQGIIGTPMTEIKYPKVAIMNIDLFLNQDGSLGGSVNTRQGEFSTSNFRFNQDTLLFSMDIPLAPAVPFRLFQEKEETWVTYERNGKKMKFSMLGQKVDSTLVKQFGDRHFMKESTMSVDSINQQLLLTEISKYKDQLDHVQNRLQKAKVTAIIKRLEAQSNEINY